MNMVSPSMPSRVLIAASLLAGFSAIADAQAPSATAPTTAPAAANRPGRVLHRWRQSGIEQPGAATGLLVGERDIAGIVGRKLLRYFQLVNRVMILPLAIQRIGQRQM